ncbi:hypothetical protein N7468_009649 [Penicillium chermesinum]|uniref:Uncharacterized protein n=1 Tax=Penicillium chermesinum TaxID=63820 RepID=A0A9W9TGB8_9EURO|nr:uncharacterized protein N7468_009649 [Penicillium chermesinum]KAJ5220445.1 hypothetical protein N7468_009649 [Penicillium chermesinum]
MTVTQNDEKIPFDTLPLVSKGSPGKFWGFFFFEKEDELGTQSSNHRWSLKPQKEIKTGIRISPHSPFKHVNTPQLQ